MSARVPSRRDEFRRPAELSDDLYPGLFLRDNVSCGSICVDGSGTPLWAIHFAFLEWEDFCGDHATISERGASSFAFRLLNMRGEFGRLLLVLAEAERIQEGIGHRRWWQTRRHRRRVADQLRRCLEIVEGEEASTRADHEELPALSLEDVDELFQIIGEYQDLVEWLVGPLAYAVEYECLPRLRRLRTALADAMERYEGEGA